MPHPLKTQSRPAIEPKPWLDDLASQVARPADGREISASGCFRNFFCCGRKRSERRARTAKRSVQRLLS